MGMILCLVVIYNLANATHAKIGTIVQQSEELTKSNALKTLRYHFSKPLYRQFTVFDDHLEHPDNESFGKEIAYIFYTDIKEVFWCKLNPEETNPEYAIWVVRITCKSSDTVADIWFDNKEHAVEINRALEALSR